MDAAPLLQMVHKIIGTLMSAVPQGKLPPDGEVSVWAVTKAGDMHLQLCTAIMPPGGAPLSDLTVNPNFVMFLDEKKRKKHGLVPYAIIRRPERGTIAHYIVTPAGDFFHLHGEGFKTAVDLLVRLTVDVPVSLDTWRRVVGC